MLKRDVPYIRCQAGTRTTAAPQTLGDALESVFAPADRGQVRYYIPDLFMLIQEYPAYVEDMKRKHQDIQKKLKAAAELLGESLANEVRQEVERHLDSGDVPSSPASSASLPSSVSPTHTGFSVANPLAQAQKQPLLVKTPQAAQKTPASKAAAPLLGRPHSHKDLRRTQSKGVLAMSALGRQRALLKDHYTAAVARKIHRYTQALILQRKWQALSDYFKELKDLYLAYQKEEDKASPVMIDVGMMDDRRMLQAMTTRLSDIYHLILDLGMTLPREVDAHHLKRYYSERKLRAQGVSVFVGNMVLCLEYEKTWFEKWMPYVALACGIFFGVSGVANIYLSLLAENAFGVFLWVQLLSLTINKVLVDYHVYQRNIRVIIDSVKSINWRHWRLSTRYFTWRALGNFLQMLVGTGCVFIGAYLESTSAWMNAQTRLIPFLMTLSGMNPWVQALGAFLPGVFAGATFITMAVALYGILSQVFNFSIGECQQELDFEKSVLWEAEALETDLFSQRMSALAHIGLHGLDDVAEGTSENVAENAAASQSSGADVSAQVVDPLVLSANASPMKQQGPRAEVPAAFSVPAALKG